MKDQYFGDINDYRKYGLLRVISQVSGLRAGICWLRTASDGTRDGEFRAYLEQPERWRAFDPQLYDQLRRLLDPSVSRSVALAESWELLPGVTYHHAIVTDLAQERARYLNEAWRLLRDCDVIFFDPDNGIEVRSAGWGRRRSSKYVFWHELESAATRGHSLLIYQHFPRRERAVFVQALAQQLATRLNAPLVHCIATPHVAYFLVPQERHRDALAGVPGALATRWPGQFLVSSHAR